MNLVVVPVLVDPEMTRKCINSVLAQDICTTPFVINNGSEDCAALLRSYGRKISMIVHATPLSLTTVWNEALDVAFRSLKLEHVLVINNDVVLRPDTYRRLLEDGGNFVTGVGVEGELGVGSGSRSPHPTFSCFLMRKKVWEKVGRFDERYWAWAVDGAYHMAMDRMGIDAYAIDLPFQHMVSGTLKKVSPAMREELCRKADADRAEFIRQYGFAIGSDAYYEAFRHSRENKYAKTGML